MQQTIRTDQRHTPAKQATVIFTAYLNLHQDKPRGLGIWIFTNPDCAPFEHRGNYRHSCELAAAHFHKLHKRFCFVSTQSKKTNNYKLTDGNH